MQEQGDSNIMEGLLGCCCTGVLINVVDSNSCEHTATHLARVDYLVSVGILADGVPHLCRELENTGIGDAHALVGKLVNQINSAIEFDSKLLKPGRVEASKINKFEDGC